MKIIRSSSNSCTCADLILDNSNNPCPVLCFFFRLCLPNTDYAFDFIPHCKGNKEDYRTTLPIAVKRSSMVEWILSKLTIASGSLMANNPSSNGMPCLRRLITFLRSSYWRGIYPKMARASLSVRYSLSNSRIPMASPGTSVRHTLPPANH